MKIPPEILAHYRKLKRAAQVAEHAYGNKEKYQEAMKDFWALADSWPEWP